MQSDQSQNCRRRWYAERQRGISSGDVQVLGGDWKGTSAGEAQGEGPDAVAPATSYNLQAYICLSSPAVEVTLERYLHKVSTL